MEIKAVAFYPFSLTEFAADRGFWNKLLVKLHLRKPRIVRLVRAMAAFTT